MLIRCAFTKITLQKPLFLNTIIHTAHQPSTPTTNCSSQPFNKVEHYVSSASTTNPTTSTEHQRKLVGYINYKSPHQIPQHTHHQSHKFHRPGQATSYPSSKTNSANGSSNNNIGGSISRPAIVWHQKHRKHLKLNENGSTSSSTSACMQNATKLSFGLRR